MVDYISRQAAIDVCNKLAKENFTLKDAFRFYLGALHDVADDIKALPPIDAVEVRHGTWLEDRYNDLDYVCSECGEPCAGMVMGKPRDRYCKWCGAKMGGDQYGSEG